MTRACVLAITTAVTKTKKNPVSVDTESSDSRTSQNCRDKDSPRERKRCCHTVREHITHVGRARCVSYRVTQKKTTPKFCPPLLPLLFYLLLLPACVWLSVRQTLSTLNVEGMYSVSHKEYPSCAVQYDAGMPRELVQTYTSYTMLGLGRNEYESEKG